MEQPATIEREKRGADSVQRMVRRRRIDCGYYVEATYTPPKYSCWSITVPTLTQGIKLLRECKRSREGQNGRIKFRLVEKVRNRVA